MLLFCLAKDGVFTCNLLCILYIYAQTQLCACEGQQSMVSSWCNAKSTLLFSGALLSFSWLGQDNGAWGLSRGHPASSAVLLVLSVLCRCNMGAPARADLPLSKADTGPLSAGRGLSPFWRVTFPCRGMWCMLPQSRVLGWCSNRASTTTETVHRAESWPSCADHESAQPEGKMHFQHFVLFQEPKIGTSFLSVNIVCASCEG